MHRITTLAFVALLSACAGSNENALRTGPAGLGVADAAMGAGIPETALNVARGVLAHSPQNAGALVREGDALAALGRTNEAVASFNKAIAAAPGAAPAHLGLSRMLLMQGDPAKAETELLLVLEKDPRDTRALVNIGIARDLLGRHAEAQAAYQQALEISPGLNAARVNLGLSFALAGNAPEATATLRPLAEQPDASQSVRHDLAVALAISGRRDEAEHAMGHDLPAAEVRAAVAAYQTLNETEQ